MPGEIPITFLGRAFIILNSASFPTRNSFLRKVNYSFFNSFILFRMYISSQKRHENTIETLLDWPRYYQLLRMKFMGVTNVCQASDPPPVQALCQNCSAKCIIHNIAIYYKKKKSKILDQCLCSQCSKHVLHLQEQKNSTDRLKK